MEAPLKTMRYRPRLPVLLMSSALLLAGCGGQKPSADLQADIDEVAQTLAEQPLLHSASIAVPRRTDRCNDLRDRLAEQDAGRHADGRRGAGRPAQPG
ncbi:hypothetical protein G6F68_020674 [Rhizopus microsporus]|nr:hypothetical protein G6F68_020674 [Rhizopus microsporus]